MTNPSDAPSPADVPIPDPIQVFNIFNQFLIRWANQECKYFNASMDDLLAPLELEQGIYFFEPFEGILVVRSSSMFQRWLGELSGAQKAGRSTHEKGAFLELVVLFWHMLSSQVWGLDTRSTKPALLKASAPRDWPDRRPDTGCIILIKDFQMEVRLWARVTEGETKAWKKAPLSPP